MKTAAKKIMNTCNTIAIYLLVAAFALSAPRTSAQPEDSRPPSQEPPSEQGRPPKPGSPPPSQPDILEKPPEVKITTDSETVVTPRMRFEHLTTEDGLSNNAITAILQDRRGFMWIGTQDGLNRFDGYHLTTYRHDPQNSNSLSSNYIEDILEDRDGVLWIATQNGVNRLNSLTGNITHYQYEPENPNSLGGNEIETIFQDNAGTLWFAGRPHVGLNEIHPDTNRVIRHDLNSIMKRFFGIFMMVEDRLSRGVFWLAGGQNLMKFVPDTQQFTAHTPNDEGHFLSSLAQDVDGHIWIGGEAGLHEFDPVTEQFDTYTITPSSNVNILYQDTAGTFWVGSDTQGLYRFDPHTNHFTEHYAYHPADVFSLSANNITALYEDAAGVLWIGTDTAGLNLYDPRRTQFIYYRYDPDDPEGFSAAVIQSLCGDASGQLWLNFGHHLDLFNPATETVAQQIQTENARGPGFHTMSCARKGGIWAGLHDTVFHLDTEHGDMKLYDPKAEIPPHDPRLGHVSSIFEDPNGVLWIGMMAVGLYRVDPERGTYTAY